MVLTPSETVELLGANAHWKLTGGYLDNCECAILTPSNRGVVASHLEAISDSMKYPLGHDTVALAMNYFDRYMQSVLCKDPQSVTSALMQSVAVTCLFIASKYHCTNYLPLSTLEGLSRDSHDHGFNELVASDFKDLELRILGALEWKIHVCIPHTFVSVISGVCELNAAEERVRKRWLDVLDVAVFSYELVAFHPCVVSSASLLLSWAWQACEKSSDRIRRCEPRLARLSSITRRCLRDCVALLIVELCRLCPWGGCASDYALLKATIDRSSALSKRFYEYSCHGDDVWPCQHQQDSHAYADQSESETDGTAW